MEQEARRPRSRSRQEHARRCRASCPTTTGAAASTTTATIRCLWTWLLWTQRQGSSDTAGMMACKRGVKSAQWRQQARDSGATTADVVERAGGIYRRDGVTMSSGGQRGNDGSILAGRPNGSGYEGVSEQRCRAWQRIGGDETWADGRVSAWWRRAGGRQRRRLKWRKRSPRGSMILRFVV